MRQKILILSLSAGSGHVRAAESLCEEAHISFPQVVCEHHDLIEFVSQPLKLIYRDFYLFVTRNAPLVWGYLYRRTNSPVMREMLRTTSSIQMLLAEGLAHFIDTFKPDEVICTHFVCADVLISILKKRAMRLPISVVITDYQIHHLWMVDGVRRYFVATQQMKDELTAESVPAQSITISGIPISPAIVATIRTPEVYSKHLLKPNRPVVLVLSGGYGLQDITPIIEALSTSKLPLQICAIAGANQGLRKKLRAIARPPHISLSVYDFLPAIHELYALSDVVISKAGGLTVSECLARGVPLIITKPLPGQEYGNAKFLRANQAALQANTASEALSKTHRIISNSALRAELARQMRKLARPGAARAILERVAYRF